MKYVIFDFNGTLVDDIDLCITSLNILVKKYLNRDTLTRKEYKDVFGFPVIDYYKRVGFDFEKLDWYVVGREFQDYYKAHIDETKLFDGVIEVLKSNWEKGLRNIVLSASRTDMLIEHLKKLDIYEYFDEILGITDIYADSKIHIARDFIRDKNPDDYIYIGDSEHDYEVAEAMGVKCILTSAGHVSRERLEKCGVKVIDDIKEFEQCV